MVNRGKILRQSVLSAGKAIKRILPTDEVLEKEGKGNFVTAADLASEREIIDIIKSNYSRDAILSEETRADLGDILSLDRLWVIDPLDGTNNFRFERNYSCVSVGYVEKGIIKAGAVYDPFRKELFFAEKDSGAYLNDRPIKVGNQTDLDKATIATDNDYDPEVTRRNLGLILRFKSMPWMLIKGSAVLAMCDVASGRIDLYFHTALKPWDNAAAFLIIKEAGGQVKDLDGADITFLSPRAIVGNSNLVQQCVDVLGRPI